MVKNNSVGDIKEDNFYRTISRGQKDVGFLLERIFVWFFYIAIYIGLKVMVGGFGEFNDIYDRFVRSVDIVVISILLFVVILFSIKFRNDNLRMRWHSHAKQMGLQSPNIVFLWLGEVIPFILFVGPWHLISIIGFIAGIVITEFYFRRENMMLIALQIKMRVQ